MAATSNAVVAACGATVLVSRRPFKFHRPDLDDRRGTPFRLWTVVFKFRRFWRAKHHERTCHVIRSNAHAVSLDIYIMYGALGGGATAVIALLRTYSSYPRKWDRPSGQQQSDI